MTVRATCGWLLGLLLVFKAWAGYATMTESVIDVGAQEQIDIGSASRVFVDDKNLLTPTDIAQKLDTFTPLEDANFGFVQSSYWVKFSLRNTTNETLDRILRYPFAKLDEVKLFELRNNTINEIGRAGRMLKAAADDASSHIDFKITLAPNKKTDFIIYFRPNDSFPLSLALLTPKEVERKTRIEERFFGIYYGIILTVILFSSFMLFKLKERVYLFYLFSLLALHFFFFTLQNGLAAQYFGLSTLWWTRDAIAYFANIAIVLVIQFCKDFLQLRRYMPRITRIISSFQGMIILALLIFPWIGHTHSSQLSAGLNSIAGAIVMAAVSYSVIRKVPESSMFLAAWFVFATGGLVYGAKLWGLIPLNVYTEHSWQVGAAIQALLLSMAIAERMKTVTNQREVAQRDALRAQVKIVNALKQYQDIYDNAIQGLFVLDQAGNLVQCNKSFAKLLGYERPAELISNNGLKNVLLKDFLPAIDVIFGEVISSQKTQERETIILNRQHHAFTGLVSLTPIFDQDSQCKSYEGSLIDLSERIAREKAEREKEAADERAKAKAEFLASMSHEIRTPMNGVLGMADLLRTTSLDEQQNFYVSVIHNSGQSLLTVINDILDYSKIEAGKLEIAPCETDLFQLLDECLSIFSPKIQSGTVQAKIEIESDIPRHLIVDGSRIRQILLNLLSNAFKFTEKGEITLRVKRSPHHPDQLRFEVSDTGIGLTSEQCSRLFQSYSQAEASTSRKYGGTGLGLVISKRLAELMGGTMSVESQPNVGSTFWFSVRPDVSIATSLPAAPANYRLTLISGENTGWANSLSITLAAWQVSHSVVQSVNEYMEGIARNGSIKCNTIMCSSEVYQAILTHPEFQDKFSEIWVYRTTNTPAPKSNSVRYFDRPLSISAVYDAIFSSGMSKNSSSIKKEIEEPLNLRLLVAEDNAVNQILIKELLNRFGITYVLAADGHEAINAYKANPTGFDAVLMDCEMPNVDGFEATHSIRQYERDNKLSRVPVIALTAHVLEEAREKAREVGMDDFISKPIKRRDLYALLSKLRLKNSA